MHQHWMWRICPDPGTLVSNMKRLYLKQYGELLSGWIEDPKSDQDCICATLMKSTQMIPNK
jgi:hypothetical protein